MYRLFTCIWYLSGMWLMMLNFFPHLIDHGECNLTLASLIWNHILTVVCRVFLTIKTSVLTFKSLPSSTSPNNKLQKQCQVFVYCISKENNLKCKKKTHLRSVETNACLVSCEFLINFVNLIFIAGSCGFSKFTVSVVNLDGQSLSGFHNVPDTPIWSLCVSSSTSVVMAGWGNSASLSQIMLWWRKLLVRL